MKKDVVIITGNPKFINNQVATDFYNEIKGYCENLGAKVSFDPGEPHTSPKAAYLWIGHSRGCDRLRFALKETKTLAFGSSIKGAINHPKDNTKDLYGENDVIPNKFHYTFTDDMKKAIKEILN